MSDETKGATVMVPGCKHDNVTLKLTIDGGFNIGRCDDCPVLIDMEEWRKLHPPPEPPKSWVQRKAERSIGPVAFRALARETAEECVRILAAEVLRRAMLEPKA